MLRKITALLLVPVMVLCLASCGSGGSDAETEAETETAGEIEEEEPTVSVTQYGIGDTWTVDGQWSLTVTGIQATYEKNPFSDRGTDVVYRISYTYLNLGYTDNDGVWDGVYLDLGESSVTDAAGVTGACYTGDVSYYPQETPIGAACSAQSCVAVENPGTVTLQFGKYDGNGISRIAVFVLDPSAVSVEDDADDAEKEESVGAKENRIEANAGSSADDADEDTVSAETIVSETDGFYA